MSEDFEFDYDALFGGEGDEVAVFLPEECVTIRSSAGGEFQVPVDEGSTMTINDVLTQAHLTVSAGIECRPGDGVRKPAAPGGQIDDIIDAVAIAVVAPGAGDDGVGGLRGGCPGPGGDSGPEREQQAGDSDRPRRKTSAHDLTFRCAINDAQKR